MPRPSAGPKGKDDSGRNPPERHKPTLTSDAFERLLRSLGADRDSGAQAYERLRKRLVKFFAWERCTEAENCADEALNRIARSLERGEDIQSLDRFALGVARLVVLESRARARRFETISADPAFVPPAADGERELERLEECLELLTQEQRTFLLDYYRGDGRTRTARRRAMARELGIDINALRNRAMRLRERVEACVRSGLRGDGA